MSALAHNTHRMLQALDAYWLHCDGLPPGRYPRSRSDAEVWWNRFERYRGLVETTLDEERPRDVISGACHSPPRS